MQIKIIIFMSFLFYSLQSFSYECRSKELMLKSKENKKDKFSELRKLDRKLIVEGLLYNLTQSIVDKKSYKTTMQFINYLENSEANQNQRAFFKLLRTTSELDSGKQKSLKLTEVCEIMEKVNNLKD